MKGKFGVIGNMDGWKSGDLPGNQMVSIVLNEYSTLHDGSVSLTTQLTTDGEVDYAVDQLIKHLELARKKAKDKIYKTNKKIRDSLQNNL